MATSLVSTGVQFPDSTIQTTAATAVTPAGATAVGSVILPSQGLPWMGVAANPTVSNTRAWTRLNTQAYNSGGNTVWTSGGSTVPFYSSYYGGWFNTMATNVAAIGTTAGVNWVHFSKDGISWVPIISIPNTDGSNMAGGVTGYSQTTLYSNYTPYAVDESNGRLWVCCDFQSVYQIRVAYADISSLGVGNVWTPITTSVLSGSAYSQQPQMNSFVYVNMGGVTANSGIVMSGKAYQTGHRIIVIDAGGTTFTNRYSQSGGYPSNNNYGGVLVWNYASQKAMAFCEAQSSPYPGPAYVTGNVNQTWTEAANFTGSNYFSANYTGSVAMSPSYNAYASSGGTDIQYSTTYGSWTSSSPGLGTIYAMTFNGTYWLLNTSKGMYYSSSATPTSWVYCGFQPAQNTSGRSGFGLRQL